MTDIEELKLKEELAEANLKIDTLLQMMVGVGKRITTQDYNKYVDFEITNNQHKKSNNNEKNFGLESNDRIRENVIRSDKIL